MDKRQSIPICLVRIYQLFKSMLETKRPCFVSQTDESSCVKKIKYLLYINKFIYLSKRYSLTSWLRIVMIEVENEKEIYLLLHSLRNLYIYR